MAQQTPMTAKKAQVSKEVPRKEMMRRRALLAWPKKEVRNYLKAYFKGKNPEIITLRLPVLIKQKEAGKCFTKTFERRTLSKEKF